MSELFEQMQEKIVQKENAVNQRTARKTVKHDNKGFNRLLYVIGAGMGRSK